jgi:hypothetical protein
VILSIGILLIGWPKVVKMCCPHWKQCVLRPRLPSKRITAQALTACDIGLQVIPNEDNETMTTEVGTSSRADSRNREVPTGIVQHGRIIIDSLE